jgi:hypothetical protein
MSSDDDREPVACRDVDSNTLPRLSAAVMQPVQILHHLDSLPPGQSSAEGEANGELAVKVTPR